MPGHGVKQSAKNVGAYVKKQVDNTIHRFDAEPGMNAFIQNQKHQDKKKQNTLLDVASFKNVRLANRYMKEAPGADDVVDWQRRTRNNELAKSLALYAAPLAVVGTGLAAYKK